MCFDIKLSLSEEYACFWSNIYFVKGADTGSKRTVPIPYELRYTQLFNRAYRYTTRIFKIYAAL